MMKKATLVFSMLMLTAFFGYHHLQAQDDKNMIGEVAPDFELKNIDGRKVSLQEYAEAENVKGAIVIFTCNHCPYAKMYEDRIVALDAKFKPMGYPVIAINPNDPTEYPEDDFATMQKRADDKGFTFPYLVDESQKIAKAYGATRTPHNYLLVKDDDGQFIVTYVGAIDDSPKDINAVEATYLDDAIMEVEQNHRLEMPYTKAIGCSIKWKKS